MTTLGNIRSTAVNKLNFNEMELLEQISNSQEWDILSSPIISDFRFRGK
jgi:hypothetical protein